MVDYLSALLIETHKRRCQWTIRNSFRKIDFCWKLITNSNIVVGWRRDVYMSILNYIDCVPSIEKFNNKMQPANFVYRGKCKSLFDLASVNCTDIVVASQKTARCVCRRISHNFLLFFINTWHLKTQWYRNRATNLWTMTFT